MLKLITGQFSINQENVFSVTDTITQADSSSKIILVLDIKYKHKEDVFRKIKNIFRDDFFDNKQDLLFRFEECMKQVNVYLKSLEEVYINGTISAQENKEIHITQAWKWEAYIIRRNKLNVIIEEDESEDPEDIFNSIASGEMFVDDKIILSSVRVLRYATASQIVQTLSAGVSEWLSSIKDLLKLESGEGSVVCFHTQWESIFKQEKPVVTSNYMSEFMVKISNQFEKIVDMISQRSGKSYFFVKNTFLASIAAILFILLITIISSVSINKVEQEKTDTYKKQIMRIESDLERAQNRAAMSDLQSSNAILNTIESQLTQMINDWIFIEDGLALMNKVNKQRDNVNKIVRYNNLEERISVDFSNKTNLEIKNVSLLWDNVYVNTDTSVYKTVLDHIEDEVIITSIENPIIRTEVLNTKEILFTLSNGGFKVFSINTLEIKDVNTFDEEGLKNTVSEKAYSRFIYALSVEDNKIWKYEKKREWLTTPVNWIKDESVDLKDAIDIAIDGSIYVLKKWGDISLLHKWKEVALILNGMRSDLIETASNIFVKPDMLHVYVFNKAANSIVKLEIVNKGLEYRNEYVFDTESQILDFYVDKNEQKLFVLDKTKVYQLTL